MRVRATTSLIFVFAFAAGIVAACGGSSSDDAAGVPDAAPDVRASPPHRIEAGPDDSDATTTTWCSSQSAHAFCADFDGADPLAGFDVMITGGSFDTTFVSSDRSAPRAFSVNKPGIDPDSGVFPDSLSIFHAMAATSPTSLHAALDLRIESLGLEGDVHAQTPINIALIHDAGGSTTFALSAQLDVRPSYTEVYLSGVAPDGGFSPSAEVMLDPLPIGSWVHLDMVLSTTPTGAKIAISYDGTPVGEGTIESAAAADLNGAYLEMGMVQAEEHPQAFICDFDNVLFDAQ